MSNRLSEMFRLEFGREPTDIGELMRWIKTPEGAAALEDCKEQEREEAQQLDP